MNAIARTALLIAGTAALLAACYLFNSKDPGLPPEDMFHVSLLYGLDEARLDTLHVWIFPAESILPDGYRIDTAGHLRTLFIPSRQP
jgi:hypothetical protein